MPRKRKNTMVDVLEARYCLDDVTLAQRFCNDHNPAISDPATHTPICYVESLGFAFYDGCKWILPAGKNAEKDSKIRAFKYLIETMQTYKAELKNELDALKAKRESSDGDTSQLDNHIEFLEGVISKYPGLNDSKLRGVLNQAPGIPGMLKTLDDFDRIDASDVSTWDTLNTPAGLVDLATGQVYQHIPGRLLTKCTPYALNDGYHYDADGRCFWLDTLKEILPDDEVRDWFERCIGYSLSAIKNHELFVMLWGSGGNGKTTIIETIKKALGSDYAIKIDARSIMTQYKAIATGEEASPSMADLRGVRLAFLSEVKDVDTFDSAKIKDITGGGQIRARRYYANPITFTPTHQLMMDSNDIPRLINIDDEGFRRRFVIVPFTQKPKYVDGFKARINAPETLQDCFRWLIDCAIKYHRDGLPIGVGGRDLPRPIYDMLDSYYREQDYIGTFLAECCDIYDDNARINASELYKAFKAWYTDSWGKIPPNHVKFGTALDGKTITIGDKTVTIKRKPSHGLNYYYGIRLKVGD